MAGSGARTISTRCGGVESWRNRRTAFLKPARWTWIKASKGQGEAVSPVEKKPQWPLNVWYDHIGRRVVSKVWSAGRWKTQTTALSIRTRPSIFGNGSST